MGQKIHPIGFRLGINKVWRSVWHDDKNFAQLLQKDTELKDFLRKRLEGAGVDRIDIARSINEVEINIFVARPGLVIGRGGANIEELKLQLNKMLPEKFRLNVQEVANPNFSASLVGQNISSSILRRYPYKRAINSTARKVMEAGAKGIKVVISGRLGGASIARTEKFSQGTIPTSTLKTNLDYALTVSLTKYGTIGIKVWINPKEEI